MGSLFLTLFGVPFLVCIGGLVLYGVVWLCKDAKKSKEEAARKAEAEAWKKRSEEKLRENGLYKKILEEVCRRLEHQLSYAQTVPPKKDEADRFVVFVNKGSVSIHAGKMQSELLHVSSEDDYYTTYLPQFYTELPCVSTIFFEIEGYAELDYIGLFIDVLRTDVIARFNVFSVVHHEYEDKGKNALMIFDLTSYHPKKDEMLKSWL